MKARHDRRFGGATWATAFGVLALALAMPVRVQAQEGKPPLTEQQKAKFREHSEKGKRLFDLFKYVEAAEEYEKAYLAAPDPVMLFNIAQCHRLNNQPDEAIRFYKSYLRNAPTASNRGDVEKRIAEMEKLSEERRRTGATPPPVGPTTPPPNGTVPPPGPTPPPVKEPIVPPPPPGGGPTGLGKTEPIGVGTTAPPAEPSRLLPKVLLIGGGVLLATSVVTGLVAISKSKQVENAAKEKTRSFDGTLQSAEKDGKAANAAAIVTGLLGVAAGAGGAILWMRSAPEPAAVTGSLGPVVYPVAGPGFAGAGARFSF
jgi:tetratricopeptide (TPR) repeat protein